MCMHHDSPSNQKESRPLTPQRRVSWKQFGTTALVLHSTVYALTLSSIYYGIQSGVDISHLLDQIPYVDLKSMDPAAGTFAMAYVATAATGKQLVLSFPFARTSHQ